MSNLVCPVCGGANIQTERRLWGWHHCKDCEYSWQNLASQQKPTLFDRITASPEVLAEKLVYSIKIISGCEIMYSSNVLDVCYNTKEKAIRATVAKLKEVEK
jgi:hypothetical protein